MHRSILCAYVRACVCACVYVCVQGYIRTYSLRATCSVRVYERVRMCVWSIRAQHCVWRASVCTLACVRENSACGMSVVATQKSQRGVGQNQENRQALQRGGEGEENVEKGTLNY